VNADRREVPEKPPFADEPVSIQVQSVLYDLPATHVERSLEYVEAAIRAAMAAGFVTAADVAYGDCSSQRTLTEDSLAGLRRNWPTFREIAYTFFDANLGSAEGHNRLIDAARSDLIVILNPDVLPAPTAFVEMIRTLRTPGVGLVEARQIPIEHAKDFDRDTGETSWGSMACALVPTRLARDIGKLDSASFFLYCDDVDFSWRLRLAGYKIIFQPRAAAYHDKRLSKQGRWIPTAAERYYSAEAALFLRYKYSVDALLNKTLGEFKRSHDPDLQRAAQAFEARRAKGALPAQCDPHHRVAQFIRGHYEAQRFKPL
jgi:GT2 family glycosyltransferase